MAPPSRARSAFMFYQSDHLGAIRRSLGPGASMGDAMQKLSSRWKSLSDAERSPYAAREEEDRARHRRDAAARPVREGGIYANIGRLRRRRW